MYVGAAVVSTACTWNLLKFVTGSFSSPLRAVQGSSPRKTIDAVDDRRVRKQKADDNFPFSVDLSSVLHFVGRVSAMGEFVN